jgi:protein LTV1
LQSEDKEKRKEEQREFGIYYEDDYDYMQHFKSTDDHDVELQPIERIKIKAEKLNSPSQKAQGSGLQLPSNVFASKQEEEVGLLNKAAPMGLRLDWDPEVLAAMDEDFDFEDPDNQLEDNFMELANAEK